MQLPSSPAESRTIVELLRARAEQHGDRRACTFLSDGESSESVLTYRELDLRARRIGSWLHAHGSAGKPVLLVYPQGLDFIAAFFGCLYAGAIAVPAYPPRRNRRATRICCMVSDAHVEIALTTRELLAQIEGMLRDDPVLARPRWQSTDQIDSPLAAAWTPPSSDPDSLAFLQYTSGSIGVPKGVMVSHANLLENQHLICHSFRQSEDIVCVGWLPLHHDMGLIGNLLHPIYLGGHFVFMSPVVFLQQPIRWLRAICNYRATISGGPNFAYDLCVSGTTPRQREGLDLSALEVAFTGAERVQDRTLRDFESAFAPYGFSRDMFCPCYGLAETTLITSGIVKREPVVTARLAPLALAAGNVVPFDSTVSTPSAAAEQTAVRTAKPIDLVSCGVPAPSIDIRIVDPETLTPCPAGRVGEIWVAGGTVAKGYWNKTDLTRETFLAPLADNPETQLPRYYLRTGDLGFLHDEHLYVAGRLKDLIIVRGGNHYPSDIEQTTGASHKSLIPGSCAAFSVDVDGDEQVVVVQEVQRSYLRSLDQAEVCEAIRQAIVEDHLVPLHAIILVRPGSVPKTTSGKIQRREARRMFEQDEYKVVARWEATDGPAAAADREASSHRVDRSSNCVDLLSILPGDELLHLSAQQEALQSLERWVLDRLSGHLGLPAASIDTHQPFARYGIDSLKAVRMTGELEEHLGRTIAPTLLYDYPNVAALVRYLVLGETRKATRGPQECRAEEPIAVIGVGCRFPGSKSPDAFWKLLQDGRDAIGPVPVGRWGADLQRISEKTGSARRQVEWGGFLERIDLFDANLFGINMREAEEMDPQQRVLLHVAWEAVEDAGISIDSLSGSLSGVFLGVSGNEYAHLQTACQHGPNVYRATGNSLAVIANRVSFLFDLQGPSWSVDTACSSSLVAVHQACVSLRRGECNLALAGGVSLIVSPDATSSLNQAGMLSATGRCQTFSSQADGFVRGEGCGVLLLKRLSEAQAAGDRILCLLRGSAVNQDGRSNGLTAPNGLAQQAVLRSALADARLEPHEIDYVEAHGTGTALGDPIEMGALAAVFAPHRAVERPLRVGSVKTNIGHLEGAAGIAGLIKVCLALQHEALPPHLHFQQPSAHIDWNWPLQIPTALTAWTAEPARPRRAGVSSFGFGGTNAHVIVEQAPAPTTPPPANTSVDGQPAQLLPEPPALLLLSAKTATALAAQARQFAQAARHHALPDLCYTAAVGRAHFPFRLALRAHDPQQVQQALEQFAQHQQAPQLWHGQSQRQCRLAWVFGGQGPLLLGAGRGLYEHHPTFRQLLDQACQCAASYWNRDLRSVLWQDATLWQQVDIQPALFCLQVSLGRLWQHYGLTPSAVLGHSLGEYAAACLAGVFSLAEGLQLVTTRARLMQALETPGGMLVVRACQQQVRDLLAGGQQALEIAALNGPRQTVVSGAAAALQPFQDLLDAHQIGHQRLATTHAFHCTLVEPILEEFATVAQQVSYAPPQLPYFSGMLGTRVTHEVAQASYWQQHLRQPVRFYPALQSLMADPPTAVLEVGAGSTACGLIRTAFRRADVCVLKGLTANDREWNEHLQQLARLYTLGAPLDWSAVWSRPGRKVSLPTYPFETQRYWFRSTAAAQHESRRPTAVPGELVHPLLGRRLDLAGREVVYETQLLADSYLRDHRLGDRIVLPATAYLELALAAGQEAGFKLLDVCQLKIRRPLELPLQDCVRMQVVLTARESGFDCRMRARLAERWQTLATCQLEANTQPLPEGLPKRQPAGPEVSRAEHYQRCRQRGLDYGPAFQGLRRLTRGEACAWGEVLLPPELTTDGYCLHPALLDACLQVTAGALHPHQDATWLPVKVQRYQVHDGAATATHLQVLTIIRSAQHGAQTTVDQPDPDTRDLTVDIFASNVNGQLICRIEGLQLRRANLVPVEDLMFHDHWVARIRSRECPPVVPNASTFCIADHLETSRDAIAARTGLAKHTILLDVLDTLCAETIFRTLHENFRPLEEGISFTTQEAIDTLHVQSEHFRLLQRMLSILEEDGYLQRNRNTWRVGRRSSDSIPIASFEQLAHDYPAAEPELTLLQRCSSQLLQVMRGDTDPLTLLFPSDGSISAGNLYRDSIGGQAMNSLVAEAVASIAGELPDARGLRILEIGAGTGSTTESIVRRVRDQRMHYVFTDIAASFLPAAKERFSCCENMQFRVLDIERDPITQGLETSQFDVIVAANVMHATRDLQQSLRHVRQLLSSGGHLIVLEGTRPVRWLDLTFGLTSGWWRFSDTHLRHDYPLLSGHGWKGLLADTGFGPARVVSPLSVVDGNREPENSVIIAQAEQSGDPLYAHNDLVAQDHDGNKLGTWLVLADQLGVGDELAARLAARGAVCQVKHGNEPCPAIRGTSIDSPVTQPQSNDFVAHGVAPRHVVFLWSLDEPHAGAGPDEQAQRLNEALLSLIQAVAQRPRDSIDDHGRDQVALRVWVVTRGAQLPHTDSDHSMAQASLWGFARTLALEHPDWQCQIVDLDPRTTTRRAAATLFDEVTRPITDRENEIAFRDGLRLVRRLQRGTANEAATGGNPSLHLEIGSRGTLDGLQFVRRQRRAPLATEIELEVHASGLNFRDVLNVLGQYPGQPPLGAECSGIVTSVGSQVQHFQPGDRVVVVAPDTFCDFLTIEETLAIRVPDKLSLEAAASIPIAFLTASTALEEIGDLKHAERVLIHAAAGGVGMAAVQLAIDAGAEIFVTASIGKHDSLRRMGIEHIYDSRAAGFAEQILDATGGQGVDLVLNSLGEEFIGENIRSLGVNGRYLDIAKSTGTLRASPFDERSDLSYRSIDLADELQRAPELVRAKLKPLLERVAAGRLQALPIRCFELRDAKAAFRFMRSARHVGKIALRPRHEFEASRKAEQPRGAVDEKHGQFAVRADRSYLISGGLGGLGLEVAGWLARKGAGHIALLARRQPTASEQRRIQSIAARGTRIETLQADVEVRSEVEQAFTTWRTAAPSLGGVFHLAGRLDDGLILRQTAAQFASVLGPKARGAWNLHRATLTDELDCFVLFSSISSALGSTGQANHAAANAFMDALARHRHAHGLPALSVNWGPWSEIGAAAEREVDQRRDLAGIAMITPAEGIALLENALRSGDAQLAALRLELDRLPTRWKQRPLFEFLAPQGPLSAAPATQDSKFLAAYRQAPESQQRSLLLTQLQCLVAQTIGANCSKAVPVDQALSDMGLDSLASLELCNKLEENLNIPVPSTLVYDYPTLSDMADYFFRQLSGTVAVAPQSSHSSACQTATTHTPPEVRAQETIKNCRTADPDEEEDYSQFEQQPATNTTNIFLGMHELSEELDHWDEVS